MTGNPWPSIVWTAVLIAAFGFLAVWGQHLSDARREGGRVARNNRRIAAERDPARRSAWRTIRDRNQNPGD